MAIAITATMQPAATPPAALVDVTGIPAGSTTLNIYRSWEGRRTLVRGAPYLVTGTIYGLTDWETPFGVDVSWQVDALNAAGTVLGSAQTVPAQLQVDRAWVQDPLSPAVSAAAFRVSVESFTQVDWAADGQVLHVAAAEDPILVAGTRHSGSSVPLRLICADALDAAAVRIVLRTAMPFLLRWPARYKLPLPTLAYLWAPTVTDNLLPNHPGYTHISCSCEIVTPPAAAVVVPARTYNGLLAEASTYSDVLTQRATYLEVFRG